MSDKVFQFVPDGLIDGAIAAEVAPPDLRAAVNVLRAAGGPGTAAELSTMAAHVEQFSAEVDAAAARISADSYISTTASPDASRSTIMISTRFTRRALSIVAITLLAAGTAAAAAGGALPMFEGDEPAVVVETGDTNDDGVEDGTDTTEQGDDDATDETVVGSIRPNHNGDVDHKGKCTAWTHGAAKSALNPAFAELQVSADAAALTIDEYCATVLETTEADDDESDDDGDESDDDGDESDDDESDDDGDEDHGNSGNENGNSGNGNGKSDD